MSSSCPSSNDDALKILPALSWWKTNMRYIIIGVIIFFALLIVIHIHRSIRSCKKSIQDLTAVVAEQQQRLYHHNNLLAKQFTWSESSSSPTVDSLIRDASKDPSTLSEIFTISEDRPETISMATIPTTPTPSQEEVASPQPQPPPPPVLNIEAELAAEIRDLEDSVGDRILEDTFDDLEDEQTNNDSQSVD